MNTLKLIYTQDEAFDLVDEYTEPLKEKIEELEEENKKLKIELALKNLALKQAQEGSILI